MPGDTTETFRYDGAFRIEFLRDDEKIVPADPMGACAVVRTNGEQVDDVIVEPGDWFARYDDELGTPFVIPATVAKEIQEAHPHAV